MIEIIDHVKAKLEKTKKALVVATRMRDQARVQVEDYEKTIRDLERAQRLLSY